MTGLEEQHVIIEVATVITDANLEILAEGPDIAINRSVEDLNNIGPWSARQHTESGLMDKVRASRTGINEAESQTLDFVKSWVGRWEAPSCGISIWVDRMFLKREMPTLKSYLHYRVVDVSSIKELISRWHSDAVKQPEKSKSHRALDDVLESIEELRWYRRQFFKPLEVVSGKTND